MNYISVYITVKDKEEGKKIARQLLEKRLIACANIIENIASLYWWKGEIQEEEEAVIIAKSSSEKFPEIELEVRSCHSYECPCIISWPIINGSDDYLKWLKENLG
jgi:periplasmic divalent cation tolerance protein